MISPRTRNHIYASGLFVVILGAAYGAYSCAMEIKKWTNATPRLQHQEMEDYLRFKEEQARRKMAQPQ